MSIRAIGDRKILLNITNMNDREDDKKEEMTPSGDNEIREARGVKADSTPPAASPMGPNSTICAQPVGDGLHCSRRPGNTTTRKDCLRSTRGCSGKFGRSSGSREDSRGQKEDCADHAAKKRKTRRGKPKHRKLKPYTKQSMSYEQRLRSRTIGKMRKTGGGQPPALYNTTQFLMEDHSDLPDLDQKLADAITSEVPPSFQKPLAPPRTRDSSFSIDSDEDYFYSSPEDEEEFLTKEFSSAYEDLHAERLSNLTKSELLQEYVQLEAKFDLLSKRLRSKAIVQIDDIETESKNCGTTTSSSDTEIAKKLKLCQQRMEDLMEQNEQLRRDNEALRAKNCRSTVSSVDSESDSDSSSNANRSSCSCSVDSAESTTTRNSYKSRREDKEHRRNKRLSSVDSDSNSTAGSEDNLCGITNEGPKSLNNESVNENGSHEVDGLPT